MPAPAGSSVGSRNFGVSTHLFHGQRLDRAHLEQVAGAGFQALELFATRSHFDYHDPAAIDRLAGWLEATGLRLHAIHAPIVDGYRNGVWGAAFSNASPDEDARRRAVHEAELALHVARRIETGFLVLHLGLPHPIAQPGSNNRDAARRSIEAIHGAAESTGVRLALEVIQNDLSTAGSLVDLIDEELELSTVGICMDFGHAFILGDVVEAVETASGHLMTTHVHDNAGREDDHLVPFDGSIDWPAALMATTKVGYEGTFIFEVADTGSTGDVLDRARRARRRFEELMA